MSTTPSPAGSEEPKSYWWDTASLASQRLEFREVLQQRQPSPDEVWWAWLKFFAIANAKGLAAPAARSLGLLVAQSRRDGRKVDQVVSRGSLGVLARVTFRGLVALAEDPAASVEEIEAVASQVDALFVTEGCPSADRAAIRLALAPRLGREFPPEDLRIMEEAWKTGQHRFEAKRATGAASPADSAEDDEEKDDGFRMLCSAAAGQMLVESLVAAGRHREALDCLWQALERDPCISLCGLAPQGMLCLGMELFWQAGNLSGAWEMHDRLALAAPVSHAWLQPAGARCLHLARTGQHARAAGLRRDAEALAAHPDTSSWHRLHYHHAAAQSLALARRAGAPEADPAAESRCREEFSVLAAAFDARNGNGEVSHRFPPEEAS